MSKDQQNTDPLRNVKDLQFQLGNKSIPVTDPKISRPHHRTNIRTMNANSATSGVPNESTTAGLLNVGGHRPHIAQPQSRNIVAGKNEDEEREAEKDSSATAN
ncbi:hypothetical protein CANARDRAFT_8930 [[Candida] arabinofermentans NRRL YB-2248]|uniref:Uncharacterized protein n=1 Tax=[Candida] arabinofermentans NRRL YB-2248 TaxID=983967 RepID=A0A1E4SXP5_9ASCO|nr:hypothetical protein CANARDRAFT_8930 [[Candida] arabinofermentans NRRL YB-2248]